MPKGPKGEKRPADVIGNAVHVMRIATGEVQEEEAALRSHRVKSGRAGAEARRIKLTPEERKRIATVAAKARWGRRS
jgi:hypothetical protein